MTRGSNFLSIWELKIDFDSNELEMDLCEHVVVVYYTRFFFMMTCSYYSVFVWSFHFLRVIFSLLKYQDVYFKKSNHAPFKMNKCNDNHIPTRIWQQIKSIITICSPPYSTWKCSVEKMLGILAKSLPICVKSISVSWNGRHTKECPWVHGNKHFENMFILVVE